MNLIIGLDESLRMFEEIGLDAVYRKQWALTMLVRKGVEALGLELFVKRHFAWGVTSILCPRVWRRRLFWPMPRSVTAW